MAAFFFIVSVAALHVLPAYRKMGLGRLILMTLALAQVRLARSILALRGPDAKVIPSESIMAHADCIDDNYPTMVFMERCGWTRTGIHNWIGLLNKGITLEQFKLQQQQREQQQQQQQQVLETKKNECSA